MSSVTNATTDHHPTDPSREETSREEPATDTDNELTQSDGEPPAGPDDSSSESDVSTAEDSLPEDGETTPYDDILEERILKRRRAQARVRHASLCAARLQYTENIQRLGDPIWHWQHQLLLHLGNKGQGEDETDLGSDGFIPSIMSWPRSPVIQERLDIIDECRAKHRRIRSQSV